MSDELSSQLDGIHVVEVDLVTAAKKAIEEIGLFDIQEITGPNGETQRLVVGRNPEQLARSIIVRISPLLAKGLGEAVEKLDDNINVLLAERAFYRTQMTVLLHAIEKWYVGKRRAPKQIANAVTAVRAAIARVAKK